MSVDFKCKFTPLGFETVQRVFYPLNFHSVNLPRWGLKPNKFDKIYFVGEVQISKLCFIRPKILN